MPGDRYLVTDDVHFEAVWEDIITVTFDANGGEGEMEGYEFAGQADLVLPECTFTPPEDTVFWRWKYAVTAHQYFYYPAGDTISVTGSITLIPEWRETVDVTYYDENGETAEASCIALSSRDVSVSGSDALPGGWYYLANFDTHLYPANFRDDVNLIVNNERNSISAGNGATITSG